MTGNGAEPTPRWYEGLTRYQWLVLAIASLGWIFDVFEGQIYVASSIEVMGDLLPEATEGHRAFANNAVFGAFLVGGAIGGIAFGVLGDRIGRTRAMVLTILTYSLFTALSVLAQSWWQMAGLRFLVAMGIGGEWAVAGALVAEVVPAPARARSLGIFHASSVIGVYLAVLAGLFVVAPHGWRWGFALGVLPALLTLWIRCGLREPERWVRSRTAAAAGGPAAAGRIGALFAADLRRRTLAGVLLATIGMATFWGVHIYGKDVLRAAAEGGRFELAAKDAEMLGMLLVTTGGGLGLLVFGPLAERVGRRGAFLAFHLGGFASAPALFLGLRNASPAVLVVALPVFGFLTVGMHAGYAVYFPELFPTRLRGTGGGFCFNAGRVLAAPVLVASGWLQRDLGLSPERAASILGGLFLLGVAVIAFAPETRGEELPE
jgi:MFS family permease